ncbi:MAG: hypothetical protein ACPGPF_06150, partial [Pontibacterium sp.]
MHTTVGGFCLLLLFLKFFAFHAEAFLGEKTNKTLFLINRNEILKGFDMFDLQDKVAVVTGC